MYRRGNENVDEYLRLKVIFWVKLLFQTIIRVFKFLQYNHLGYHYIPPDWDLSTVISF